ncbi:MAG: carbohydrate ABC transporter permease [Chloroflexi bacterium]|nr:carbohydrate ABC transporter permease [Chloroflexota bacterium]
MKLAIQSRLVPGDSLREKREKALQYGFDGIELSHAPMIEAAEEAVRDHVPVSAMCSGHRGWFIDPAARIDGAGHWTIYARIILPLSMPALVVVAVFTFLGVWNDFFGPLLYLDDPQWFTVPLALAREVTTVGTEWNIVMAATLVAMLPPLIIYAFSQNKLMGGIASVGIHG